jgi:hypothetical protein
VDGGGRRARDEGAADFRIGHGVRGRSGGRCGDGHPYDVSRHVGGAVWRQGGPSFFTETFVNVTKMPNGQQLSVGQITENYDSEGAFAGAVGTSTRVTTGFSYTIDASQLSNASASGSDLPATTCTYDTNYDLIGCVDSTIDVNVSWTGQGELIRGNSHHHDRTGGIVVTAHLQGVFRDATASGVVGDITLTSGDLFFADISRVVSGETVICIDC